MPGCTLLFGASTQIINIPMLQKVSYDPEKDLVPISIFGAGPYLLGIKASLPVNTLQEFIAYVKANLGKLAETYPGFNTSSWNGIFAPTSTPAPILDLLAQETAAAARKPEVVERLKRLAILPFGTTQDEFRKVIAESRVANRLAMKAAGLPIME